MTSLKELFNTYQQYHGNRINKLTHYVGVPALIVAILMLLNWVSIDIANHWKISFNWFLVIGALVYYFMLNIRLAAVTTVVLVVVNFFCSLLATASPNKFSGSLFLILLVVGVVLQVVGHTFEKQRPSWKQGLNLFAVSPLFWIVEVLCILGFRKYLDLEDTNSTIPPQG